MIDEISMSHNTITRRVEDLGSNLHNQLKDKSKTFECFSLALDESTDVRDTAQLLIFIHGINDKFQITEELVHLQSLHDTTTGGFIQSIE